MCWCQNTTDGPHTRNKLVMLIVECRLGLQLQSREPCIQLTHVGRFIIVNTIEIECGTIGDRSDENISTPGNTWHVAPSCRTVTTLHWLKTLTQGVRKGDLRRSDRWKIGNLVGFIWKMEERWLDGVDMERWYSTCDRGNVYELSRT